jgi:DNA-binding beta-propeller fold protein YncE
MKNVTKEDGMFLKRLLKGSVITGIVVLLLFLAMGKKAGAESYSFRNQIGGLSAPLDVAVGPDGRVYVADQSNFRVVQFDEFGNFANQCLFQSFLPQALAVSPDGGVYYVTRFGPNGDVIRFSSPDSCGFTEVGTASQFTIDYGVVVAPDGSVFISDFYNDNILKFGPDGSFIKKWGTQGNGVPDPGICSGSGGQVGCDAQFNHPKGLAIFGGELLLVADSGNNRIQGFDLNGNFLGAIGSQGTGQWQFNSPDGIAVGPHGNVYISDTGNNRVEKFSVDDGTLSQIDNGTLSSPEGLSVDQAENVYVTDSDNNRVAVFTPDVVVFENGASSKVVTGDAPFGATVSISPDVYWQTAPKFELYMWLEAFGLKAYWAGLPLNLVLFNSPGEMKPLLSAEIGVPAVNNLNLEFLSDSSGLPAGTYTLHLCIDRNVNGTFNPSASVCGSINIVRQ